MRRHIKKLSAALAVAFAALNAVAWMHAGALSQWSDATDRTERPEDLGPLEKLAVLATGVSIPRPMNRSDPRAVGLPFETLRFENGVGDELEAWHVPTAESAVVAVLLHGHAGQKDSMLAVAQNFVELGADVLLVDFYGSGGSSGSGTTVGIREAHDVHAAVEFCRSRWPAQRVVLYGQSMGGAAALRAVDRLGTRVDGLAVESTFDSMHSTVAARFHRMGLPATPFAQLLLFWGGVRMDANPFTHNPASYAASVTCPFLVMQGDSDRNVTLAQGRRIAAAASGWNRFSSYPKVGHVDLATADPERWRADLQALFEQL